MLIMLTYNNMLQILGWYYYHEFRWQSSLQQLWNFSLEKYVKHYGSDYHYDDWESDFSNFFKWFWPIHALFNQWSVLS